jgi:hypothetical protein
MKNEANWSVEVKCYSRTESREIVWEILPPAAQNPCTWIVRKLEYIDQFDSLEAAKAHVEKMVLHKE